MNVVNSPYTYNLTDASLGWHTMHISASDLTGRAAWLNQSLYVDGSAPTISVEVEDDYPSGEAAEITAIVADDYGVGEVVLYYEAEDGSYTSVEMTGDGGTYTTLLEADVLRAIHDNKTLSGEVKDLALKYKLDLQTCRQKTKKYLHEYQKAGLIYAGELMKVKIVEVDKNG